MKKLWAAVLAYKELLAGLVVIGAISAWVAKGIAEDAGRKADATAQALQAVAETQKVLAETQQAIGIKVATQEGKVDALLASLNLAPDRLAALQALPRAPRLSPTDSNKVLCGQTWLQATRNFDTLLMVVIDKACKAKVYPIYPPVNK